MGSSKLVRYVPAVCPRLDRCCGTPGPLSPHPLEEYWPLPDEMIPWLPEAVRAVVLAWPFGRQRRHARLPLSSDP